MTELAKDLYNHVKRADPNMLDSLTSQQLIGIDLRNARHFARYIYKLTNDESNWPDEFCPFLGEDLTRLHHTVFDSRKKELAMYGITAEL